MNNEKQVRNENRERLLELLKKGNHQVYTVLRNVSRSGMTRHIDLYTIIKNEPVFLSWHAAEACDWKLATDGSVKVGGCGMDMGFHLVNTLSMELYCPEKYDHDSAYKLKHNWI